jgi:hypothetical protein
MCSTAAGFGVEHPSCVSCCCCPLRTSVSDTKRLAPMDALRASMGSSSLFMLGNTDEASRPNTDSTSYTSSGLCVGRTAELEPKQGRTISCCCQCAAPSTTAAEVVSSTTHCSSRTISTGSLSPMPAVCCTSGTPCQLLLLLLLGCHDRVAWLNLQAANRTDKQPKCRAPYQTCCRRVGSSMQPCPDFEPISSTDSNCQQTRHAQRLDACQKAR